MNLLGIFEFTARNFVLHVAITTLLFLVIGIALTCYEFHKDAKRFEDMKRSQQKKL